METNYKPNSHKYKEEQAALANTEKKEIKKVTKGTVTTKKEPVSRKFAETFLSSDVQDVKGYLLFDVIIPAVKDAIVDTITNGVSMMFYGTTGRSSSGRPRSGGSRIDYTSYSNSKPRNHSNATNPRERYSYDDVIFDTRGDAQEVKDCMEEILDRYHMVTVADFYELAGTDSVYTDGKYGWYELNNIAIMRDSAGYRIKLPKPVPID